MANGCITGFSLTVRISLLVGCLVVVSVLSFSAASYSAVNSLQFLAPLASSIEEGFFDGTIGSEWDDALKYEVALGRYDAEILLKHDRRYLYVGVVIDTSREIEGGFECYVVLDNGDGQDYSLGDDMILVAAEDRFLPADYYYSATYSFHPDSSGRGTDNAHGIGSYVSADQSYVFEFRREIASVDKRDVALEIGSWVTAIYGWASY